MRFTDPAGAHPIELAAGVPTLADYEALLGSPGFAALAGESDAFLARNRAALADYARRWVADPLRQWSRRWEYPYVLAALQSSLSRVEPPTVAPRILDAGSGVTFFPFLVAERLGASVTCCDRDGSFPETYRQLTRNGGPPVDFEIAELQSLPWADTTFEAIYCISVLEHTEHYASILEEFERVLRPGGVVVVTFDISFDGRCEIAPDAAREFLRTVGERFEPVDGPPHDQLERMLAEPGHLTTAWARQRHPDSLPWRRSLKADLAQLARFRRPAAPFYLCTVWCGTFRRRR